MYPRWVNLNKDILSKKYEFKELELTFDIELKNYKQNLSRINNNINLSDRFKRQLITNHISANSTIYSEKIEHIDLDKQNVMMNDFVDGLTVMESLTANNLFHAYNNTILKEPLSIQDICDYHKMINVSDRKIKPGVYRNPKTNPVNIEIEANGVVFVEYQEVKKQLNNLLKFINFNDSHPAIKSAIIHGYLVAIHPFNDGNGRLSRFIADKYLEREVGESLNIGEQIFKDLDKYYEVLNKLAFDLDLIPMIKYVLDLLSKQMNDNIDNLTNLVSRHNLLTNKLNSISEIKESYIEKLSYLIINNESITITNIVNNLNVTRMTAIKIINSLLTNNIIGEGVKIGRTVIYKLKEIK